MKTTRAKLVQIVAGFPKTPGMAAELYALTSTGEVYQYMGEDEMPRSRRSKWLAAIRNDTIRR